MNRLISVFYSIMFAFVIFSTDAFPATVEIQMVDFSFKPKARTIAAGDTVKWTNAGQVGHTSTSGSGCVSDGKWDSGTLSPGQSFSRTFAEAGTFKYFCTPHCSLGMTGTIVVKSTGANEPKISVSPSALNLGTVKIGTASDPKTVTISNKGTSDLTVSSVGISGTHAAEFSQTNDCATIASGGACAINVVLTATSPGKKSAILDIASNDPKKSTVKVRLKGNSAPPVISVRPAALNFGTRNVGVVTDAKSVIVKNTGKSDLVITTVGISGTNSDEFTQTNDCTTVVQAETCSINVVMTATSAGKKSAILNIVSNAPKKSTARVKLSGRAASAAKPALRPEGNLYFGDRPVTNEDMAAFLVVAAEGEVEDDYCAAGSPFMDVLPDRWSCKYIKKLNELGLAAPCGTDRFCPEAPATGDMLDNYLLFLAENEEKE